MKVAYLLFALALGSAGAAAAQDSPARATPAEAPAGPDLSFNLALATDYVFRGISQTDEEPAVQGGVDAALGRAYLGAWGSSVDFGDGTDVEMDLYAGFKPEFAGWTVDLGLIYYAYLGQPDDADWDYLELKAAASRGLGPATVGAAAFWSPEFTGATGEALYAEVNASLPVTPRLSFSGAVGRQAVDEAGDYTVWNLGAVLGATDNVSFDLRYWDTGIDDLPIAGERIVLTLKVVG